jgi:ubiquinone/menaquinone biosynthesis C-methylase UbiE
MNRIKNEKDFHNERFTHEVRESSWKFYTIEKKSRELFKRIIQNNSKIGKYLEIGCGKGNHLTELMSEENVVCGIDISEVAIEHVKELYKKEIEEEKCIFEVMNVENMNFDSNSFDFISGSSILHHLKLDSAFSEITRVLKKTGSAVFIEPLGHNIFINAYRAFTPSQRTKDEHPFINTDIKLLSNYFEKVEVKYFHLLTLLAVPFRKLKNFENILKFLEKVDKIILQLPWLKYQSWQIVVLLSGPKK